MFKFQIIWYCLVNVVLLFTLNCYRPTDRETVCNLTLKHIPTYAQTCVILIPFVTVCFTLLKATGQSCQRFVRTHFYKCSSWSTFCQSLKSNRFKKLAAAVHIMWHQLPKFWRYCQGGKLTFTIYQTLVCVCYTCYTLHLFTMASNQLLFGEEIKYCG